jgi:carbon storage regulator
MLVLSRRLDEVIVIGANVRIIVTSIAGGQVRLAIEAPPEVLILREEIMGRPSSTREMGGSRVASVAPLLAANPFPENTTA